MKLTQPTISHHMQVLTAAGLVHAQKVGRWMWYRRNEPAIRRVLQQLKQAM
jgi:ArsR family transcriptional regulator